MITITRPSRQVGEFCKPSQVVQTQNKFWFDGNSANKRFTLPYGWVVDTVFSEGLIQREGKAENYTVENDGFKSTVVFTVAPAMVSICVMAKRIIK